MAGAAACAPSGGIQCHKKQGMSIGGGNIVVIHVYSKKGVKCRACFQGAYRCSKYGFIKKRDDPFRVEIAFNMQLAALLGSRAIIQIKWML